MNPDELTDQQIKMEAFHLANSISSRHSDASRIQVLEIIAKAYAHMLGTTLMSVPEDSRTKHKDAIMNTIDGWVSDRILALNSIKQ